MDQGVDQGHTYRPAILELTPRSAPDRAVPSGVGLDASTPVSGMGHP
jgi:hypothetical protein